MVNKKLLSIGIIAILIFSIFNIIGHSKIKKIDKNIRKILFLDKNYFVFSDENKIILLDLEKNKEKEIPLNFKDFKVIGVFKDGNILFTDTKSTLTTLAANISLEGIEDIKIRDNYLILKQKGKYSVYDSKLKEIIPPDYTYIERGEKYFLAQNEMGKFGYIDNKGKEILSFKYLNADLDKNNKFLVKLKDKTQLINKNNKVIFEVKDGAIMYLNPKAIIKSKDDFYLYSSKEKREKLDISWAGFYNGETLFYEKNGRFGLMNKKGKRITENIYDNIGQNNSEAIIVGKDDKYNLINQDGEILTKKEYEYIIPIKEYYFIVGNEKLEESVLNYLGEELYFNNLDNLIELGKEYILEKKENNLYDLINKSNVSIIENIEILVYNSNWLIFKDGLDYYYMRLRRE